MGHLGEGTQITTVQDKEIVLTASNGQNFRMKVADLAEAVRQVMPVATSENNGLAPAGLVPSYNIAESRSYNVIFRANRVSVGLVLVSTGTQDSDSTLCDFFMHIRTNGDSVTAIVSNLMGANIPNIYYRIDGSYILFAIQNNSNWSHVSAASFSRLIAPLSRKILSIEGWIKV